MILRNIELIMCQSVLGIWNQIIGKYSQANIEKKKVNN